MRISKVSDQVFLLQRSQEESLSAIHRSLYRVLTAAMAMEVSFRQLNGEAMVLEVMPDITGRELKERIKDRQLWDDELTRKTTRVDILAGPSRLLTNDETAADAGLTPESDVIVILRQNAVTCSHKGEFDQFGEEFDLESLFVVEIPSGATEIVPDAFIGCTTLASVTIPDSVTQIGMSAFARCRSMASVTIPNSVTQIGTSAFAGCSSLASVTIPDSVAQIGTAAFGMCSCLASLTIPNSVTQIGDHCFGDCSALTSVVIPDSVTKIGSGAFSNCSALTLVVPITRKRLKLAALKGCKRILAKECECQECDYKWFLDGWECPRRRGS